jgi:intein/homing endonuclease
MTAKPKLTMEIRSAETLEVQLICTCCGQPYYPDKSWEDRIRAIIFGAEEYAMCPLCTQAVPDETLRDERYRARCRYKVERLRELFGSDGKGHSNEDNRTEPTYEELKARVEELGRRQGSGLRFKVSEKGALSVYGFGRFPVTLYYEQWVRLLASEQELRRFLATNRAKVKRRPTE